MELKKSFSYYINYFFRKENLIQKYVIDESDYFFSRIEWIESRETKKFYTQLVCSTMADSYDFFMDILKNKKFSAKMEGLDEAKGRKIYKLNAIYFTIKSFISENSTLEDNLEIKNDMFKIFNFSKNERKDFERLVRSYKSSYEEFERDFSKYVIKTIMDNRSNNQAAISFISNFFYYSYKEFINSCNNYFGFKKLIPA